MSGLLTTEEPGCISYPNILATRSRSIYFDGLLPPSKLPVRLERIIKGAKDISTYYAAHLTGVPPSGGPRPYGPEVNLFPEPRGSSSEWRLPAPPFLVPALIEALVRSDSYSPITRVVPGEADAFCAHDVYQRGSGTTLTSDSDLLLYDLGQTGSVVFFRDIELDERSASPQLIALKYMPTNIRDGLSLPVDDGLLRLAFESTIDSHLSFEQLLKKAKFPSPPAMGCEYETFTRQYDNTSTWYHLVLASKPSRALPSLDTRISELVLQIDPASAPPDIFGDKEGDLPNSRSEVNMFLPLLLDCPSRISAWETSADIRRLAYAALQLIKKSPCILERRRLQTAFGGKRLELPALADLEGDYTAFYELMTSVRDRLLQTDLQWVVLSIHRDIVVSREHGRQHPLSLGLLQRMATGRLESTSWDFVHFVAQVQGTYYSCRMLQQILSFVSTRLEGNVPGYVSRLQSYLAALPPISSFPTIGDLTDINGQLKDAGGFSCLLDMFGSSEELTAQLESVIDPLKRKTKQTAKKEKFAAEEAKLMPILMNNPFGLLAMDS